MRHSKRKTNTIIKHLDLNLKKNNRAGLHKKTNSKRYPLMMMAYDKDDCLKIVQDAELKYPMYLRFRNCFKTGMRSRRYRYWQKNGA